MHLIQASVTAAFVLAQGALAFAISPSVTAGMALAGGVLLAVARPLVRRSRTLGGRLTAGGRATHVAMTEFLGGLKLAKVGSAEARHVRDFTAAIADMRRHQLAFVGGERGRAARGCRGASASGSCWRRRCSAGPRS